jgi:hypothetical protein
MNNYKNLDVLVGTTIDSAVQQLLTAKENGILAKVDFNGTELFSDTVTLNNAYLAITGKTKKQSDQEQADWKANYDKEKQDHKNKLPELVVEWNKKGEKVLDPEYLDEWYECVPIRLGDLYRGMELGACLELVKHLTTINLLMRYQKFYLIKVIPVCLMV